MKKLTILLAAMTISCPGYDYLFGEANDDKYSTCLPGLNNRNIPGLVIKHSK